MKIQSGVTRTPTRDTRAETPHAAVPQIHRLAGTEPLIFLRVVSPV
jgi:hypothetical protein